MGFMRKALFLGTGGLSGAAGVKANSKKERTAKALEKQVRMQKQQMRSAQRAQRPAAVPAARRVNVNCPKCGTALASPVGNNIPCPHCGFRMKVWALDEQPAPKPSAASDVATFDVALTSIDARRRIEAIKVVRGVTGLGLAACEQLVDQLPSVIKSQIESAEANALKARFGDHGAVAEVRPAQNPASASGAESETERADGVGLAAEIERLADLHGRGVLSDEEFAAAKRKILSAPQAG